MSAVNSRRQRASPVAHRPCAVIWCGALCKDSSENSTAPFAPRERRLHRAQALIRVTHVVDVQREFVVRGQHRRGHREHRGRAPHVELFDADFRRCVARATQFARHTLHLEARRDDAVLERAVNFHIAAALELKVLDAVDVDAQLRAHGKRARGGFVERFGQPALDSGERAGERQLPGVAGLAVIEALRRARPGNLAVDAARRIASRLTSAAGGRCRQRR